MKRMLLMCGFLLLWIGVAEGIDTLTYTVGDTASPHNRDYRSIANAEALNLNLVSSNAVCLIKCYDDFAGVDDTLRVDINGWTTSDSTWLKIYTPTSERHDGTINSGYCLAPTDTDYCIYIRDPNVTIEGLVILPDTSGVTSAIKTLEENTVISQNVISGRDSPNVSGISSAPSSSDTTYICGNIVYGCAKNYIGGMRIWAGMAFVFNNTLFRNYLGIMGSSSDVLKNNACFDSDPYDDYYNDFSTDSRNNCSSDASADFGQNNLINKSSATNLADTTTGSEDLHIKDTNADIYHAGIAITDDWFPSTDIDGDSWASPPSIGADEYVTEGEAIKRVYKTNIKGSSVR